MNKKAAQELARSETLSIGDLRKMIDEGKSKGGMSSLNPSITMEMSHQIFSNVFEGRDDSEIPKAWQRDIYSRHADAQKPSRDFLIVTNILRDFGTTAKRKNDAVPEKAGAR